MSDADADQQSDGAPTTEEILADDDTPWYSQYLRDHRIHTLTVLALAAYPPVYTALEISPASGEAIALLPEVQTMVAVLYFGLSNAS